MVDNQDNQDNPEIRAQMANMTNIAKEQANQMKQKFDQNIPIEEIIIQVHRDHGQVVALLAGTEFIHWFVNERIPMLGIRE